MQKFKISFIVVLVLAYIFADRHISAKRWLSPPGIISSDVAIYYSYLPAFFVYNDISLSFIEKPGFNLIDKIWGFKMSDGHFVIKMSMGVALLNLPFFLVAHTYCLLTGTNASGFSTPYEISLVIGSFIYIISGFIFLRKLLLLYFSEWITALCLLCVGLGTNLLNYATHEACMAHGYLFCLFNIFIWYVIKWDKEPSYRNSAILGFAGGLISLIRPTDVMIFLILILYNVRKPQDLFDRLSAFLKKIPLFIVMFIMLLIVWLPQMIYWKHVTGQILYFSYVGDTFDFSQPHLFAGLFSYRKGWLLYTPIMIISIIGFFYMYRMVPSLFAGTLIFFLSSVYIIFSWWCWWYGGSFGQRPFVDMYGLLAIPLGCLFTVVFNKKWIFKLLLMAAVVFFIKLNIFQTRQYINGIIHWDAMTKEAYWAAWFRETYPPGFQYLLRTPDYKSAILHKEKLD